MEYRPLGRTGVMVSEFCLGTMMFGAPTEKDESFRIIDHALDRGVNFVDTANVYAGNESERIVGEALATRRAADAHDPRHQGARPTGRRRQRAGAESAPRDRRM